MKAIRLLTLAGLLTVLFPLQALANPGQACVFDSDLGIFVPEQGSGACFEDFGFGVTIFDEDNGAVSAGGPPADNQWFRVNRNGKVRGHVSVDVPFLVYCSAETIAAGDCNPFSGQGFEGTGTVKLNTEVNPDGLFFDCPITARVNGIATDGFGNTVELAAALTLVPDDEEGCRATVRRIDVMPVVD